MRAVIQRVKQGSVAISSEVVSNIQKGVVILLGIGYNDTPAEATKLAQKIVRLRIFDDADGVMNLSLQNIGGEALIVSQFTLMANCRKGNRPSYIEAARGEISEPLYKRFVEEMRSFLGDDSIKTGTFGADMLVSIDNDGPVTILLDTDFL